MPDRALLNDANPHLINFYRWLQRGLQIGLPRDQLLRGRKKASELES